MKVICFGVRDTEKSIFEEYNKNFNYELTLVAESLNIDTVEKTKDYDAIICRASDKLDKKVLETIHNYGIKYVLTRTVGFDHIDVEYAKSLGIELARVPCYSPTAIAEVSVSMAIMLSRRVLYFGNKSLSYDFSFDNQGFAKELKNSTVGILGVGKIGYETAKMYKSLGANVIGYDVFKSEMAKQLIEFKTLDEVLNESDIISVHIPYIKEQNDKMINADFINKMKDNAILINVSRGQIQDDKAILDAIKANKLYGVGLDVLHDEKQYFGKQFKDINDPVVKELIALYPRVIITPHIGSYTDEAVANMVEISYMNLKELVDKKECKNKL